MHSDLCQTGDYKAGDVVSSGMNAGQNAAVFAEIKGLQIWPLGFILLFLHIFERFNK
jgi:hypothetical protein